MSERYGAYLGGDDMTSYVDNFMAEVNSHVDLAMSQTKTSVKVRIPNLVLIAGMKPERSMLLFKGLVAQRIAKENMSVTYNGDDAIVEILSPEEIADIEKIIALGRNRSK
jgi:hypothetical protein